MKRLPITQQEVELLNDYIIKHDALMELKASLDASAKASYNCGYVLTPEWAASWDAQKAIWDYAEKTGRWINTYVGLYAGNVWD